MEIFKNKAGQGILRNNLALIIVLSVIAIILIFIYSGAYKVIISIIKEFFRFR